MTSNDIPQEWQDLLKSLQGNSYKALLAGGAIRDLWCGHTVKDLDFFVVGLENLPSNWMQLKEEDSTFDYEGMQYVQGVVSYGGGPLPINLIHCDPWDSTEKFLQSFDFGLNQIGFDGKEIVATGEFHWDYKYSLFTLRHGDRYTRSLQRFNRINERYGWEMVIGDGVVLVKEPEIEELPF